MLAGGEVLAEEVTGSAVRGARLLVVDQDPSILELLTASLRFAGFEVTTARTGATALRLGESLRPDLLVLAAELPDVSGIEVVRRLRAQGFTAPAVFLTSPDAVEERIAGLTLGGDECLAKPFSLDDAVARMTAVLRRHTSAADESAPRLVFADLELDTETREAWRAGKPITLSPTEFKLLRFFMANPRRVLSKAAILDHVWSYDFVGELSIVESYLSYLRRKVDTVEPRLLHTVRGAGYVLRMPQG